MAYLLNKLITIVDDDPRWPRWYAEEQQRLRVALYPLPFLVWPPN